MNESLPDRHGPSRTESRSTDLQTDCGWTRWPATWFYVLFSGLDIALTYQLLVSQDHVEINPVARYFIRGWGLKGMVWFKLVMTVFVLTVVHTLLQKSRRRARFVVRLGAILVGSVVAYSAWLLSRG